MFCIFENNTSDFIYCIYTCSIAFLNDIFISFQSK